jgi:hypothetical protein
MALEGSRFKIWQLYASAAGGSLERFDAWQFYRLRPSRSNMHPLGGNTRSVMLGSRLLSHFPVANSIS